jgi:hypothetical protein
MSERPPAWVKDAKSRLEWVSKMPGVIVHRNPNPVPYVPDIRVREGVTVSDILGWDEDDEGDDKNDEDDDFS